MMGDLAIAIGAGSTRWLGRLDLGFVRRDERTMLARRKHVGPLVVQRTFAPEPGVCHAYVLHPPGGLVGGDRLEMNVSVGEEASALITTPSANKFYRSAGAWSDVNQCLTVDARACLEWLPQETIVFDAALGRTTTTVDLAQDAKIIAWDIVALGRSHANECFARGEFRNRLVVTAHEKLLLDEHVILRGDNPLIWGPWGLNKQTVFATLYIYPGDASLVNFLRDVATVSAPTDRVGITAISGLVAVRWSGDCSYRARQAMQRYWMCAREKVLGRAPCIPRIWAT